MAQRTFKRYELKYMVDEAQAEKIVRTLSEYMKLDKYCREKGAYMIYNIYFDTDNDDIIRKSLSKPYYKEKLRLRCYKIPLSDDDTVFLELKKKIGGVVSKRRATMSYGAALRFLDSGEIPENLHTTDTQVLNEIAGFLKRYPAKPKVYISYERVAFYGKENREFRVTFDKNILTRRENPSFKDGDFGTELLDSGKYLMEVKTDGALCLWFAEMLSKLRVYSTSYSKYGEEYKKYARARKEDISISRVNSALSHAAEQCNLTA